MGYNGRWMLRQEEVDNVKEDAEDTVRKQYFV